MSEAQKPQTKLNIQSLRDVALKEKKYAWLILLIFFVAVYGYIVLQINNFSSAQPTQFQVSSYQKTTTTAPINPVLVKKLESMKNNSVSVQALFNQSRSSPF